MDEARDAVDEARGLVDESGDAVDERRRLAEKTRPNADDEPLSVAIGLGPVGKAREKTRASGRWPIFRGVERSRDRLPSRPSAPDATSERAAGGKKRRSTTNDLPSGCQCRGVQSLLIK